MLKAVLIEKGNKVNIYCLEKTGKSEVLNFFKKNKTSLRSEVNGFFNIIDNIAKQGFELPDTMIKSWREEKKGTMFHELIRGKYRISCFKYKGDKILLLTTIFKKEKQVESKEYKRAINLKKDFDNSPIWEN